MKFFKAAILAFVLLLHLPAWTQDEKVPDASGPSATLNEDETRKLEEKADKFSFQADIARLMDIIVNALYTHKEVFLRELISNGSDALDKIRYLSIKDPDILKAIKELKIMIEYNKDEKTISITDTGIGMTREDLIKNLGTVAKSGTAAFVEALQKGDTNNLIGQFGVGFYSTYLVANKVVVTSKHNNDDQHIWISEAGSSFSVIKDPKGNTLGRGTKITIYLKDDAIEYTDQDTVKNLAKRYSEFINYPIYIRMQKQVTKEVEDTEAAANKTEETPQNKTEETVEVKEEKKEEKKDEKKTKTVTETKWEWELINDQKALWLRNKDEITEKEYFDFYKSLTKATDDPVTYTHVKAEGDIEFKSILYVPNSVPYDLFENYYGRSKAIRLYVKRVLITDEFEELLPRYMNFLKGVLDSDDLPLNVNREQLQQQKILKVITKKLVRSAIKMLENLAKGVNNTEPKKEDDEEEEENKQTENQNATKAENGTVNERYQKFWTNFGKNLKLGVIEDSSNRNALAKLLRFYSTKSLDKLISLDEYIARKKPKQDLIYYIAGDNKETLNKSPLLQKLKNRDIEVLLLDDPIDEYCMNSLNEYNQHKVQNAGKGDIKLFDEDPKMEKRRHKKFKEIYKPLTEWLKKHLDKKVEKVEVATRLTDSPCAISTSEYGYSANMERISRAQAFANPDKMASYLMARRTFEINPGHPIIKKLLEKIKEAGSAEPDHSVVEMTDVLYDSALLNSGFVVEDPASYFEKVEKIVRKGFEIDEHEIVEEPHVEVTEEDDDDDDDLPPGIPKKPKMPKHPPPPPEGVTATPTQENKPTEEAPKTEEPPKEAEKPQEKKPDL